MRSLFLFILESTKNTELKMSWAWVWGPSAHVLFLGVLNIMTSICLSGSFMVVCWRNMLLVLCFPLYTFVCVTAVAYVLH